MKKLRLTALALAAALCLGGCSAMLERGYSSTDPHVEYSVADDSSILRAESYQALVNSILYYVSEHSGGGTIRLYNYTGNVETDLAVARTVVMADPLGAYAVDDIRWNSTRILTYYEVDVHITYRHTIGEVASIRPVSGEDGIRRELAQLVSGRLSHTVLRVSYFTGDEELVSTLFRLALFSDPVMASLRPEVTLAFYPKVGSQRILELELAWPEDGYDPAGYRLSLEKAADLLLAENPPAGESYTPEELSALLHGVLNYAPDGSHTALAALSGEPVSDQGTLLAMEYLCQRCGIEVTPVIDSAQMWLILSTPSGYRHLLPRSLRPAEEGAVWAPAFYTDEELTDLGFVWPAELYPACVDYSGGMPE